MATTEKSNSHEQREHPETLGSAASTDQYGGGVRLTIEIGSPQECPIAGVSETTGADVDRVTRTAGGDTVTEEFALPAEATLDRTDITEVMRYDSERVYRFRREAGQGCACESVEQFGYPVSSVRAHEGALSLSCHAATVGEPDGYSKRFARISTAFACCVSPVRATTRTGTTR